MPESIQLPRKPLRTQIADAVWDLVLAGDLPPGTRLREVDLASRLGVSRTPLREALLQMEQEGIVVSEPAKGFAVAALSARDVNEIYPLRALLEPYALQCAGLPDSATIEALQVANRKMESGRQSVRALIDLDEDWHSLLIRHCPNQLLLRNIENLKQLSRRYEYAYMRDVKQVDLSTDQHRDILSHLESGDLDAACSVLADNMTVGMDSLLDWVSGLN